MPSCFLSIRQKIEPNDVQRLGGAIFHRLAVLLTAVECFSFILGSNELTSPAWPTIQAVVVIVFKALVINYGYSLIYFS